MLVKIFKAHNLRVAALVGREFAPETLARYETCLRHTQEFLAYQYNITDIDVKKIDHSFITDFDFFLRSNRKCANNSAVKYIGNFGKIIRSCLSHSWIAVNPFASYKGKIKTVERVFLSSYEIERIEKKICYRTVVAGTGCIPFLLLYRPCLCRCQKTEDVRNQDGLGWRTMVFH